MSDFLRQIVGGGSAKTTNRNHVFITAVITVVYVKRAIDKDYMEPWCGVSAAYAVSCAKSWGDYNLSDFLRQNIGGGSAKLPIEITHSLQLSLQLCTYRLGLACCDFPVKRDVRRTQSTAKWRLRSQTPQDRDSLL